MFRVPDCWARMKTYVLLVFIHVHEPEKQKGPVPHPETGDYPLLQETASFKGFLHQQESG
jgi:hypothetical protein